VQRLVLVVDLQDRAAQGEAAEDIELFRPRIAGGESHVLAAAPAHHLDAVDGNGERDRRSNRHRGVHAHRHRSLDRRADEDEEMSPLDRERMLDLESDGHLIGTLLPRPVRVNRPNNFPGCSVYLTRRRNPYDNLLSKPPSSDPATS